MYFLTVVISYFSTQELLKYTSPDHSDYDNVMEALKAMREVASSINEKKRQVENIQKIAEWQLAIEQWEVSTLHIVKKYEILAPLLSSPDFCSKQKNVNIRDVSMYGKNTTTTAIN